MPVIVLFKGFILKPHFFNLLRNSVWFEIFKFFSYPKVYAINFRGIFLVSIGFFCLNEPEAALRGFANLFEIFLKSLFLIKTSPLISISLGKFTSEIKLGISFLYLI